MRGWYGSRREVLRIVAVGGAGAALWGVHGLARGRGRVARRTRVLMGTQVELQVVGDDPDEGAAAADAALDEMAGLEARLTRYRADSELARLQQTRHLERASGALLDVLRLAEEVARLGDGAFDVTVQPVLDLYQRHRQAGGGLPDPEAIERARALVGHDAIRLRGESVTLAREGVGITLDGIAKGYVVDRGVAALRRRGLRDVFVEAGGDLMASGQRGGDPWRVGIRSPRGLRVEARFEARDRAVATSGDYLQAFTDDFSQHHILDPRTGRSAPELASATVVAPDAARADALATLAMVLGPRRGRALVEDLPDCEAWLVAKDGSVTRTSGFRTL